MVGGWVWKPFSGLLKAIKTDKCCLLGLINKLWYSNISRQVFLKCTEHFEKSEQTEIYRNHVKPFTDQPMSNWLSCLLWQPDKENFAIMSDDCLWIGPVKVWMKISKVGVWGKALKCKTLYLYYNHLLKISEEIYLLPLSLFKRPLVK